MVLRSQRRKKKYFHLPSMEMFFLIKLTVWIWYIMKTYPKGGLDEVKLRHAFVELLDVF